MATETVENYLKALLVICDESPTGEAGLVRLAGMLGVTRGTATSMVKRLTEAKLAKAERYGGISLTTKGRKAALDVLRRHRLIETFLVEMLGFDWGEVHEEAERLEHAVSPRLLARMDDALGHPSVDPHGDPIPTADGTVRRARSKPLAQCVPGAKVRVTRITDQDAEFLRFVAKNGLRPGARAVVVSVDALADAVRVEPQGHDGVTLSRTAAGKISVETASGRG